MLLKLHIKNNFLTSKTVHAVHKKISNLTLVFYLPIHLYTKQKGDCTHRTTSFFCFIQLFILNILQFGVIVRLSIRYFKSKLFIRIFKLLIFVIVMVGASLNFPFETF